MLRWFVFTIGFGLLPLAFRLLLEALHSSRVEPWNNTPELLFFCVMVCAVELGEILTTFSTRTEMGKRRTASLATAFCVLLIGAIVAAGLYGIYMDHERTRLLALATDCSRTCLESAVAGMDRLDFQRNLFRFSVGMSAMVGAIATSAEVLRTRRQS